MAYALDATAGRLTDDEALTNARTGDANGLTKNRAAHRGLRRLNGRAAVVRGLDATVQRSKGAARGGGGCDKEASRRREARHSARS